LALRGIGGEEFRRGGVEIDGAVVVEQRDHLAQGGVGGQGGAVAVKQGGVPAFDVAQFIVGLYRTIGRIVGRFEEFVIIFFGAVEAHVVVGVGPVGEAVEEFVGLGGLEAEGFEDGVEFAFVGVEEGEAAGFVGDVDGDVHTVGGDEIGGEREGIGPALGGAIEAAVDLDEFGEDGEAGFEGGIGGEAEFVAGNVHAAQEDLATGEVEEHGDDEGEQEDQAEDEREHGTFLARGGRGRGDGEAVAERHGGSGTANRWARWSCWWAG
jgi:hypothetical protein